MLYWYAQTEDGGSIAVGSQSKDDEISRVDSEKEFDFYKKIALSDSIEVKDASSVEVYFKKKWIIGYVKSESKDRSGRIMRAFLVSDEVEFSKELKEDFTKRAMEVFSRFSEISKFEFKTEDRDALEKALLASPDKKKMVTLLIVFLGLFATFVAKLVILLNLEN